MEHVHIFIIVEVHDMQLSTLVELLTHYTLMMLIGTMQHPHCAL